MLFKRLQYFFQISSCNLFALQSIHTQCMVGTEASTRATTSVQTHWLLRLCWRKLGKPQLSISSATDFCILCLQTNYHLLKIASLHTRPSWPNEWDTLCTLYSASSQARVSAHGFRDPGTAAWAEHFSPGGGLTLSAHHSSCLVFTNTLDRVLIYSWGFEKQTPILGIARDAGRLSANHVGSFVNSEWVGISAMQTRRTQ